MARSSAAIALSNSSRYVITSYSIHYTKLYDAQAVDWSRSLQVPVVATNDVRFLDAEDFEAHEVRYCICNGFTLEDERRPRLYSPQQYLRSADEMVELFSDIPAATANSVAIAEACNLRLHLRITSYNVCYTKLLRILP